MASNPTGYPLSQWTERELIVRLRELEQSIRAHNGASLELDALLAFVKMNRERESIFNELTNRTLSACV